jgi:D-xylose transport system substrate-binding protein
MRTGTTRAVALAVMGAALLVAACGGNSTTTSTNTGPYSAAKGCKKVGVLLPESNTSPRWESYDHQDLVNAIGSALPGAQIIYSNANGDQTAQQSNAEAALTQGACILVVAPHDSAAAASIVTSAKAQHVPVIAYDRLIQSNDLQYYVSFDNVKVGELQGTYIANNYTKFEVNGQPANVAIIKGAQTDNNAVLFAKGGHNILDPLQAAGKIKYAYETYTVGWLPANGLAEVEAALTQANNNIQVVYTANDDLGGAAIQALAAQHLAGKVLVTGQDASVGGIQRIIEGTQAMTVYKPIQKEADATAKLVADLSNGTSTSADASATTATTGGANIPSALETPISVDISNYQTTVVSDGYVTKAQICTGLPAGTNTNGFCS